MVNYTERGESKRERARISVTRLGDLLDFGNFSKPFVTNNLPKSLTFLGNFCKGAEIFNVSSKVHFWGNFYRHLAIFTGRTASNIGQVWVQFRPIKTSDTASS